jgi:Protein of unknown function (DUF664)
MTAALNPGRPFTGSERELLENTLTLNRTELLRAVEHLSDTQARERLVPSLTTPISLLKHCAAAETHLVSTNPCRFKHRRMRRSCRWRRQQLPRLRRRNPRRGDHRIRCSMPTVERTDSRLRTRRHRRTPHRRPRKPTIHLRRHDRRNRSARRPRRHPRRTAPSETALSFYLN